MNVPTIGLAAAVPGLRTVRYDAQSAGKVSLIVQPGDTLIVSDDVAGQLVASSAQFKPEVEPEPGEPEVEPEVERPPRKRAAKPKN